MHLMMELVGGIVIRGRSRINRGRGLYPVASGSLKHAGDLVGTALQKL